MKKIEKDSIKYLIISTVAIIIAGIILYPVLDMFYTKYITRSEFVYSVSQHILAPIGIGTIIGICSWLIDKFGNKCKK